MTVVLPEFGGQSSPAKLSAESNLRDVDDAKLQTQTRIWLGEVLQIRFDEKADISDILADGNLLFELSEVLSRMSPSLAVDATQSKTNEPKSFASSKSTRRYMSYHNVASFLKMCTNLGLNGIDLFTPSDVVEKRNTRKVCMCIRSLSKRAGSKDLNVPDFDNVTCTLTMPTNMVECNQKSLKMAKSSSSLSVGLEADNVSSVRCWNRMSNSASTVSNEYSSDMCDDAESSFMVGVSSNGPSDYSYHAESPHMSCSENEEDDQCVLSPSNGESLGPHCSHYLSDQESSTNSISLGGEVYMVREFVLEDGFKASVIPVPSLKSLNMDSESFCDEKVKEDHLWKERVSRPTENLDRPSCNGENHICQLFTEVENGRGNSSCDNVNKLNKDSEDDEKSSVKLDLSKAGRKSSENSLETWMITEDHKPHVLSSFSTALDETQTADEAHGSEEDTGQKCLINVEDIEKENLECMEQEGSAKDMPRHKPPRKLLNSVVNGAVLLGIAVFLFRLRSKLCSRRLISASVLFVMHITERISKRISCKQKHNLLRS